MYIIQDVIVRWQPLGSKTCAHSLARGKLHLSLPEREVVWIASGKSRGWNTVLGWRVVRAKWRSTVLVIVDNQDAINSFQSDDLCWAFRTSIISIEILVFTCIFLISVPVINYSRLCLLLLFRHNWMLLYSSHFKRKVSYIYIYICWSVSPFLELKVWTAQLSPLWPYYNFLWPECLLDTSKLAQSFVRSDSIFPVLFVILQCYFEWLVQIRYYFQVLFNEPDFVVIQVLKIYVWFLHIFRKCFLKSQRRIHDGYCMEQGLSYTRRLYRGWKIRVFPIRPVSDLYRYFVQLTTIRSYIILHMSSKTHLHHLDCL